MVVYSTHHKKVAYYTVNEETGEIDKNVKEMDVTVADTDYPVAGTIAFVCAVLLFVFVIPFMIFLWLNVWAGVVASVGVGFLGCVGLVAALNYRNTTDEDAARLFNDNSVELAEWEHYASLTWDVAKKQRDESVLKWLYKQSRG